MNIVLQDEFVSLDLLLFGLLWPLLLSFMLALKPIRSLTLQLAPWAALPALAASLLVAPSEMRWHLTGVMLGSELGLDATGKLFLLLTALLWTVTGIYARTYFSLPLQRTRFYIFFLLTMAGNFGLILAHDLLSFYLGFALMSFAAYGLVIFNGTPAALRAGRVYIILVVLGELMIFAALVLAAKTSQATTFTAVCANLFSTDNPDLVILLGLIGFGIKAGILGMHVWLPLAHPVAPAPASAVLSGTMIKAGLLGWLRLLPLGEVTLPGWGTSMLILGLMATFYAAGVGLTQREPKTLLAYSSISQMGIMTMAIGLGLLAPHAWPGILPVVTFYVLHHGLSKSALFLGVGLGGSHHLLQRRWIWLGMCLPALALAGAPWTSGMLAKMLLKTHILHAQTPWDTLLPPLLSASAVSTALLMARLLYLIRPAARLSGATPVAGLVWPWLVNLTAILLLPWWLMPTTSSQESMYIMDSLWPLLLACLVTIAVLHTKLLRAVQPLPAGDVLLLIERGYRRLCRMGNNWAGIQRILNELQQHFKTHQATLVTATITRLKQIENGFVRWEVASLLMIILAVVVGLIASQSFSL